MKRSGQIAWITGGGTGIGRALALLWAAEGGNIALSGRRRDRLEEVAEAVRKLGREALVIACDVTDEASCEAAIKDIEARFGRLDVAIANAGFGVSGRLEQLTAADWRRQLDVNVVGVANTAKWALPALRKSKGRLVLISSVMGMATMPGQAPYAASKFAVRAIGLTLAQELHGSGVTCTTIYPGFVESEIGQVGVDGVFDPSRVDKRPKKMMWGAERAARVMWDAIDARKREYVFTGHGKIAGFLGRHMPGIIHFAMTRPSTRKKVLASTKAP
jgi:NAD(P)-dependent dehydrogenase (short-subunit alcohol dehydrogenase family)